MVGLVALSGCSSRGVYDMPLPGGADVGDHPYDVKVRFSDVLDLVPNAGVRVNDVAVGRVSNITLAPGTWDAEVTVTLNGDVRLPANSTARLRQSSLLGEKYVELSAPPQAAVGRLRDGATIGLDRTGRNPEVEEVLGALSLLLNGGGVAQLQDITKELNKAMSGRESDIRSLLDNLDELVAGLDAQRNDIVRALDSINRLSAKLNEQRGSIDVALRDLGPGLKVLNEQRGQLVTMLQSLDELSGVATNVVDKSHEDLVHDLNKLAPTLHQLAAAGDSLPKSLETLVTFPFPDNAVDGIGKSDYNNLYLKVDLNLTDIVENLGRSRQPLVPLPDSVPLPLGQPQQQQPAPPKPAPEKSGGGLLGWLFGGDS
ncbi:MCE family protein [Saccharopolyspora rhizosphaerae]|uniref:MCE family protein n=1 Tax=Saccharopolyspora rhizosphaerae TaxID=2492662 RepID=A0A3R8QII1_9PSEU|nr:MCE family protein [Saccharopolyspora rhizosphaerae]RRO13272.1 MCE family protein [Saccharopolyspora rhizosphaerae]